MISGNRYGAFYVHSPSDSTEQYIYYRHSMLHRDLRCQSARRIQVVAGKSGDIAWRPRKPRWFYPRNLVDPPGWAISCFGADIGVVCGNQVRLPGTRGGSGGPASGGGGPGERSALSGGP